MKSGLSARAVARQLNVAPSTISREIKRAAVNGYRAKTAHSRAAKRRRPRYAKRYKITGDLELFIRKRLKEDLSPDQIVERMKHDGSHWQISYRTIYRFVDRMKKAHDGLWRHLRILRRERKDRKKPNWRPGKEFLSKRRSIDDRPKIVEERARLGDVERDTMLGKFNGAVLLTIVDRTSRYVWIAKVAKKNSEQMHRATVRLLKGEKVHTITNDNGNEFFRQERTEKALNTTVYFSNPYSSWERGTNENTNGLLRQYFPRETPIDGISHQRIRQVQKLLNNRPRKCLGYLTPLEVHRKLRRVLR